MATQQHFAKIARVRKRGLSLKTRTSSQTRTQTNAFNNKRKKRTLVGITTEEKEVDNILKRTPLCVVSINCVVSMSLSRDKRKPPSFEGGFITGFNTLNIKKKKRSKKKRTQQKQEEARRSEKKKNERSHTARKKE